jgi:hypothetical protein
VFERARERESETERDRRERDTTISVYARPYVIYIKVQRRSPLRRPHIHHRPYDFTLLPPPPPPPAFMSSEDTKPPPPSRLKVALTVLFHSTCAISVTLITKSALNGIELPITLLAMQTSVQVVLLSVIGRPLGWIRFRRPLSVCFPVHPCETTLPADLQET